MLVLCWYRMQLLLLHRHTRLKSVHLHGDWSLVLPQSLNITYMFLLIIVFCYYFRQIFLLPQPDLLCINRFFIEQFQSLLYQAVCIFCFYQSLYFSSFGNFPASVVSPAFMAFFFLQQLTLCPQLLLLSQLQQLQMCHPQHHPPLFWQQ